MSEYREMLLDAIDKKENHIVNHWLDNIEKEARADERARITHIIEQELESGYLMEKLINEVNRNG